MISTRFVSVGAVLLAACLWGTTGTVQTLLPGDREPVAVGALRLAFGALFLLGLAVANRESRKAFHLLPPAEVVIAGIAIGGYNLLFFYAVSLSGVGIGTALTIGSAPLWATLWEIFVGRKLPGKMRTAGQCVSIIGVGMLGLVGTTAEGSVFGIILALGAGACYACYSLATSRMTQRAPTTTIAAATFSIAAVITLPALLFVPLGWLADPSAWVGVVFLGFVATGLAYAFYTWGLMHIAASTAVTLALAEPVTAWLLATFFVGETATMQSVIGAVLVLLGLIIVTCIPVASRET
ncbi:DMT family transporter [Yoonia maritima]|uniref:DMT family transporter n=1 Tax=Yoonia maritima TaxID=1435347 RepID=UPI000D1108DF|nr:EamA family transporter [Yoonia maritima]